MNYPHALPLLALISVAGAGCHGSCPDPKPEADIPDHCDEPGLVCPKGRRTLSEWPPVELACMCLADGCTYHRWGMYDAYCACDEDCNYGSCVPEVGGCVGNASCVLDADCGPGFSCRYPTGLDPNCTHRSCLPD